MLKFATDQPNVTEHYCFEDWEDDTEEGAEFHILYVYRVRNMDTMNAPSYCERKLYGTHTELTCANGHAVTADHQPYECDWPAYLASMDWIEECISPVLSIPGLLPGTKERWLSLISW